MNKSIDSTENNLSFVAGNIVSSAIQATRNIFCPFCADCFNYEFTLKDHLKEIHPEQLSQYALKTKDTSAAEKDETDLVLLRENDENICKFCDAVFMFGDLLPKHIADYHGPLCYRMWEQQNQNRNNKCQRTVADRKSVEESMFLYANCSPGVTELFERFSCCDSDDFGITPDSTPLKGILKKSVTKSAASRIICSPSSAGIRRAKNATLVRRSSSAKRELRFDFDNENNPNDQLVKLGARITRSPRKKRNRMKKFLFGCLSHENKSPRKIITSTPISGLDETDKGTHPNEKRNLVDQRAHNKPLFSQLERFQCAHCNRTWESNAELLTHLNEKHKNVRRWFQADYRCASCSTKFYSNRFLVRHCHNHHTPMNRFR